MLQPQLIAIATDRVRLDAVAAQTSFSQRLSAITSELTSKGMYRSGRMPLLVNAAIREAAAARAMGAWQVIARVVSAAPGGLASTSADELKALVTKSVTENVPDLRTAFDHAVQVVGQTLESFDSLVAPAIARAHSEIDIAFLSSPSQAQGGPTINIYQSYGIVQTGHGSTATLTLSPADTQQLSTALDEVARALDEAQSLPVQERTQALELVADARQELARPTPNTLRLRGALSGIATTIQTLGSAAAAYQVLKLGAALVGLSLP